MYKNEIVNRYTENPDDKLTLVQILDNLNKTRQKNILTMTHFLNERQRAMAEILIKDCGNPPHSFFGGYKNAQRTVLFFLPDYIEEDYIAYEEIVPLSCIRAEFSKTNDVSHRDLLGGILGTGIKREMIGDILVGNKSSDIVVMKEILPYLESNFNSAGRAKLKISVIPLSTIIVPEEKYKLINDTVASLRLDSIVSSGFYISRKKAVETIRAGKVFKNHLECEKSDKSLSEGDSISVRGMGKAVLHQVGHTTKKGRIHVVIKKFI